LTRPGVGEAGSSACADGAEVLQAEATNALMPLAAYPAPKPLSMFTTVRPLAQELSMPSKAVSPPKWEP